MNKKFTITFSPLEEQKISQLELDLYNEELNKISNIENDTLTIKTIYVYETENELEAKVLLINSSENSINFENIKFILIDENKNIVQEESADATNIGIIPSMHVRPTSIYFKRPSDIHVINEKLKVFIKQSTKAEITFKVTAGYIDEKLNNYEKMQALDYIENIPPVKKEDIQIIPYKHLVNDNEEVYCIMVLVNGFDRPISISNIQIIYKDYFGIVRAIKKIDYPLKVKELSASVYSIMIEKNDIIKHPFNIDEMNMTIEKI